MYWPQKALLHDHMDGSFPMLNILPQLFRLSGKKYPFNQWHDHHEQVKRWFKNPQIDIIKKFSLVTGVMKSWETLSLAAETYVKVRARQGFRYCEATIAPQYHLPPHLDEEVFEKGILDDSGFIKKEIAETLLLVVNALIDGVKKGEAKYPEIEVNLLLSVGREVSPLVAVRLVELFAECDRNFCPGIGLVCNEAAHPPEKHFQMFKKARELGFKTTCHAGEWCTHEPDFEKDRPLLMRNLAIAIFDLEVDRIGHAIPLAYDDWWLLKAVVEKGIGIEGCPGSNLSCGLISNTKRLDIRKLLKVGVNYSLNPDDDLFVPNLNEVFRICDDEYRFTEEEKQKLLHNPWLNRFGNRKQHNIQT